MNNRDERLYLLLGLLALAVAVGLVFAFFYFQPLAGLEYEAHCNLTDGSCYP